MGHSVLFTSERVLLADNVKAVHEKKKFYNAKKYWVISKRDFSGVGECEGWI